MGAGNQSIRGLPAASTSHKIYNVESPSTVGAEFSQALSSNVKQLMIKCRSKNKLQFTFVSGESGTKYITIEKNAVYKATDLNLEGQSLYMQVNGSNLVIEIEEWT